MSASELLLFFGALSLGGASGWLAVLSGRAFADRERSKGLVLAALSLTAYIAAVGAPFAWVM